MPASAAVAEALRNIEPGPLAPIERSWAADDALLYAIAVGAGQQPERELELTTENNPSAPQRVLPTFLALLDPGLPRELLRTLPTQCMVHGGQSIQLTTALPANGQIRAAVTITGVYDTGRHAIIRYDTTLSDAAGDHLFATLRRTLILRDAGGFGGSAHQSRPWATPAGEPDHEVAQITRPEQALIYRLCRDRNPLHSDPRSARAAGFEQPILHGLCTFGFAARALLAALCDGDVHSFGTMSGRFAAPMIPGQRLLTRVWGDRSNPRFQVLTYGGAVVIDRGSFTAR